MKKRTAQKGYIIVPSGPESRYATFSSMGNHPAWVTDAIKKAGDDFRDRTISFVIGKKDSHIIGFTDCGMLIKSTVNITNKS